MPKLHVSLAHQEASCAMDPTSTEDQAEALSATRRALARIELAIFHGFCTVEDRELLEDDSERRQIDDLRVFAEWHAVLGTNSSTVPREMLVPCHEQFGSCDASSEISG